MTALQAFNPSYGKTASITVTATSASLAIDPGSKNLQLFNVGANVVWVRVSKGPSTASLTSPNADFPIGPNSAAVITKDMDANIVSAIASATGNTLWVTNGEGW